MSPVEVIVVAAISLVTAHLATTATVRWARHDTIRGHLRPQCIGAERDGDHVLGWVDALPLVSWLLHRGHCRTCGVRVPGDLLAVELATLVITPTVLVVFDPLTVLVIGPAAVSAPIAATIDLRLRIIPNRLTLPLAAWTAAAAVAVATTTGQWLDLRRALITGIAVSGGLLAVSLLFELVRGSAGLGMGDVKWALGLGTASGWLSFEHVLVWLYGMVGASLVVMVGLLVTGRATMAQRVPYGPYLAAGALLALVVLPAA